MILSRIVRVVVRDLKANITEADLQGATSLDEVVPMDSISLLEFAMGLEREFAIELDSEHMERDFLLNLPRLVKYLEGVA